MQNTIEILPSSDSRSLSKKQPVLPNYEAAERQLVDLLEVEDLDKTVATKPLIVSDFESAIAVALRSAYQEPNGSEAAHRFLQRVLYRINRLNLFWYDDLRRYNNERSHYLRSVRDRIEEPWQQWEIAQIDVAALQNIEDVKQALRDRADADVAPERTQMDQIGAIASRSLGSSGKSRKSTLQRCKTSRMSSKLCAIARPPMSIQSSLKWIATCENSCLTGATDT